MIVYLVVLFVAINLQFAVAITGYILHSTVCTDIIYRYKSLDMMCRNERQYGYYNVAMLLIPNSFAS